MAAYNKDKLEKGLAVLRAREAKNAAIDKRAEEAYERDGTVLVEPRPDPKADAKWKRMEDDVKEKDRKGYLPFKVSPYKKGGKVTRGWGKARKPK